MFQPKADALRDERGVDHTDPLDDFIKDVDCRAFSTTCVEEWLKEDELSQHCPHAPNVA